MKLKGLPVKGDFLAIWPPSQNFGWECGKGMFEWCHAQTEMSSLLLTPVRLLKYLDSAFGAANGPGSASVTNLLCSHLTLIVACLRPGMKGNQEITVPKVKHLNA